MKKVTWKDELVRGLQYFGGEAHRKELFEYIQRTTEKNIPTEFEKTLQKELERLSSDSDNYSGEDIFYSVEGIGAGIWGLKNYIPDDNMDKTQDAINYPEGKEKLAEHIRKERNSKLIRDAKAEFKKKNGSLYCEVCGINFETVYGKIGKDFIEAHHNREQVADMEESHESKIDDLIMLCPNCHSMVHRLGLYSAKLSDLQKIIIKKPIY